MTDKYGVRTDCTRDNRRTILPNSSLIGYSTRTAKRGSWLLYKHDSTQSCGRVVGRVHCEGKTYVEAIVTDPALTMTYVRWIDPADVCECYAAPHRRVMEFLLGPWKDVETILATSYNGFRFDVGSES